MPLLLLPVSRSSHPLFIGEGAAIYFKWVLKFAMLALRLFLSVLRRRNNRFYPLEHPLSEHDCTMIVLLRYIFIESRISAFYCISCEYVRLTNLCGNIHTFFLKKGQE